MAEIAAAYVSIMPSFKGFDTALARGTAPAAAVAGKKAGGGFAAGMKSPIAAMGAGLAALGIGKVIKDSVNLQAQFSQSMNVLQAATGASSKQMGQLKAQAMDLGAKTVFSANDAADAMVELGKAGFSTKETMQAVPQVMNLAATEGMDLGTASGVVTSTLSEFGLKANQAGLAVNALAGASNASKASVSSLSQAMTMVGSAAHGIGANVQETSGALAALAQHGLEGSMAGTSLAAVFNHLQPQTKAASAQMKSLGLDFVNTDGSFKSVANIAGQLHDKLGKLKPAARQAAISDIFGKDASTVGAVNALMAEGAKGLQKYTKASSDQNAASNLAKARMKGLSGALESLGGAWETFELAVGQAIGPLVTFGAHVLGNVVLPMLTKLATELSKHPGILRTLAVAAVSVAVAYGTWKTIKAGVNAVKSTVGAVKDAKAAFDLFRTTQLKAIATNARWQVMLAKRDMKNMVSQLKTGVSALGSWTKAQATAAKTSVTNAASSARAWVSAKASVVKSWAVSAGSWVKTQVLAAATAVRTAAQSAGAWVAAKARMVAAWAAEKASLAATTAATVASAVAQKVVAGASKAWAAAQWLLNAALDANPIGIIVVAIAAFVAAIVLAWKKSDTFRAVVTKAWNAIKAGLSAMWKVVGPVLKTLGGLFAKTLSKVRSVTGTVVSFIVKHWRQFAAVILAPMAPAIALVKAIINNWGRIKKATSATFSAIRSVISSVAKAVKSVVSTAFHAVGSVISAVMGTAGKVVKKGVSTIKSVFHGISDVVGVVKNIFGDITGAVKNAVTNVIGAVKDIPSKIKGVFSDAGSILSGVGKSIIDGLVNGIKGALGAVENAVASIASHIPGPIKKIMGIHSPSRVMMSIGGHVVDGLVLGMDAGTSDVAGASTRMAKALQVDPSTSVGVGTSGTGKAGGGAFALTITNWDEGTGYIEAIADDRVSAADQMTGQSMRAGAFA